jgi:hypothetical protein
MLHREKSMLIVRIINDHTRYSVGKMQRVIVTAGGACSYGGALRI